MNVNTTQSMNQPEPEEPKDQSIMVNMSSLGDMGASLKVGDTVPMKVESIEGDMVQMCPAEDDSEDEAEDTDPKTMPLDKLEASLPKADRE